MSMNVPKERPQRHKTPSFSSILLDSIYHSIDETRKVEETRTNCYRKDNILVVDDQDVKSLSQAMMLEKFTDKHSSDSSFFSETPKSLCSSSSSKTKHSERTQIGVHESRFTRTKSRVLKIYGDFKKVKQPMSPGTRIAKFLNSVFSSRNLKKHQTSPDRWSSMRNSRSVKDPTIFSCLSKTSSSSSKPKHSVRFGSVSVIEQSDSRIIALPQIGSNYIRENIYNLPSFQDMKSEESDEDDDVRSCTSSDLFELENISVAGNEMHREELPVFGTTNMRINQVIASSYVF